MPAPGVSRTRFSITNGALASIEHRRIRVRRPKTNGFVERFNRGTVRVLPESVPRAFPRGADALQRDLDHWLVFYNTAGPIRATATRAGGPFKTVEQYLRSVPKLLESKPQNSLWRLPSRQLGSTRSCVPSQMQCHGHGFLSRPTAGPFPRTHDSRFRSFQ